MISHPDWIATVRHGSSLHEAGLKEVDVVFSDAEVGDE